MQQSHSYCPECGNTIGLVEVEQTYMLKCSTCKAEYYFDPKVSAVCALISDNQVLLIKRGNEPGYGKWSLPGGYVDRSEKVEDAVIREIREETGLRIEDITLLGVYSSTGSPVIVIAYLTRASSGHITPNHEVLECGFFDLNTLPELAFPRDEEIIRLAAVS